MRTSWNVVAWAGAFAGAALAGPVTALAQESDPGQAQSQVEVTASAPDTQPAQKPLELGVFVGGFFPSSKHEFYDYTVTAQKPLESAGPEAGLRLGYYPLPYVGVEGEADLLPFAITSGESALLFGARAQVVLQAPVGRFTPFALAGFGMMGVHSDMSVLGDDVDAVAHVGLGAKFQVSRSFDLRVDGRYLRAPKAGDDKGTNHFALLFGASYQIGGGAAEPPPPPPDPDGDGITGAADHCPEQAGDPPNGCPAVNSDKDGLNDDVNKCPNQAETVNGYEDDDGCPDQVPDKDGDGLSDALDSCPDQAEDVDGYQDTDGCPDPDNDADGVLDAADHCPGDKGPVENNGCPDTDKDKDGVVDRLDNCPDEPGTEANHGCKKKQLVVLTQTQLKILDKVYFHSNKDRIRGRSHRLLNNVAQVLINHPEIKVRIEGHTDARGDDAYNKDLSQRRASAVMTYLVKKGVPAERLEAVGFGEEKPVASNDTPAGRAQNRRVEFNIVAEPAPSPASQPAPAATHPAPSQKN